MGNDCWVLHSRLAYFWRNMNISSIFYFSKWTLKQYSSLWDTLKIILFLKYLIKWKCIGKISWKFWYWFHLKSSIEFDIKRWMLYLSNAPLSQISHNYMYFYRRCTWEIPEPAPFSSPAWGSNWGSLDFSHNQTVVRQVLMSPASTVV